MKFAVVPQTGAPVMLTVSGALPAAKPPPPSAVHPMTPGPATPTARVKVAAVVSPDWKIAPVFCTALKRIGLAVGMPTPSTACRAPVLIVVIPV